MKKLLFVLCVALCTGSFSFAQSGGKLESNFHLGLDLQTKYVWRGMEMMTSDAAPVVFPQINYQNGGLYVYVMGGSSINGKYSEVDMGVSYTYKWLTIGLNDYYYPTVDSPFDQYFNFKNAETGHWLELLNRTDYIDDEMYKSLSSDCASIRVMLISSINTTKSNR